MSAPVSEHGAGVDGRRGGGPPSVAVCVACGWPLSVAVCVTCGGRYVGCGTCGGLLGTDDPGYCPPCLPLHRPQKTQEEIAVCPC